MSRHWLFDISAINPLCDLDDLSCQGLVQVSENYELEPPGVSGNYDWRSTGFCTREAEEPWFVSKALASKYSLLLILSLSWVFPFKLTVSEETYLRFEAYWFAYIWTEFKCRGLHTIKSALSNNYYPLSFDLKAGYHNFDIFSDLSQIFGYMYFRGILAQGMSGIFISRFFLWAFWYTFYFHRAS